MKVLQKHPPTSEQLKVIRDYRPGIALIRGAAGSGKTTTALLRLRFILNIWLREFEVKEIEDPLRVLVVTFNRTLRGYIQELARDVTSESPQVELGLMTFGNWSWELKGRPEVLTDQQRNSKLKELGQHLSLPDQFLNAEIDYAQGRYLPEDIQQYVNCRREGRGRTPGVGPQLRQRLIQEVLTPYEQWKRATGRVDWNDLAVEMLRMEPPTRYDIAIIDESQDLSGNQIRGVMHHMSDVHSTTFILDGSQRIYPRYVSWREVGVTVSPQSTFTLGRNFRNTSEIAAFARPLVEQLDMTDDSMLPDLQSCTKHGALPKVLAGRYSRQVQYAIEYINSYVDLRSESVAFLSVRGGAWFDYLREALEDASIPYVEITRRPEWPAGDENIALSTLHSAKGLEFDHVFILGLADELTPHGDGEADSDLENYQRLVAMAVCRARNSVVIGYKPGEESAVVQLLDPSTFDAEDV